VVAKERIDISFKGILNVALPIMLMGIAHNVINAADTAFMGRLGEIPIGAVGNGAMLYFIPVLVFMGLSLGGQIIIGRRNGEGNQGAIGQVFWQTLFAQSLLGILGFFTIFFYGEDLMHWINGSEEIAAEAAKYLKIRAPGLIIVSIAIGFNAFYIGITKTRIVGIANAIMATFNVGCNYVLVFGKFGFPALGIEGAAWASLISEVILLAAFILYLTFYTDTARFNIRKISPPDWSMIFQIFKIGGPAMFQGFITLGAWLTFFTLIEHLGTFELAVSHLVRVVYIFVIIPIFSLSDAASTLTSNLIGENRLSEIKSMVWKAITIGWISNLLFFPFFVFYPEQLAMLFTDYEYLAEGTANILRMMAGVSFIFTVSMILSKVIIGAGKTIQAFYLELLTVVIYFVYIYVVIERMKSSLLISWTSEFIYFGFMLILSALYLKYGKWKDAEV
jgi:putative MATE family efflux protein